MMLGDVQPVMRSRHAIGMAHRGSLDRRHALRLACFWARGAPIGPHRIRNARSPLSRPTPKGTGARRRIAYAHAAGQLLQSFSGDPWPHMKRWTIAPVRPTRLLSTPCLPPLGRPRKRHERYRWWLARVKLPCGAQRPARFSATIPIPTPNVDAAAPRHPAEHLRAPYDARPTLETHRPHGSPSHAPAWP